MKRVDILFRQVHFNPRPPWGGRLDKDMDVSINTEFQSTPSVGRATIFAILSKSITKFQSTPSVGRATPPGRGRLIFWNYFNPRPPWGGRHKCRVRVGSLHDFNPRPPWGGRREFVAFCRAYRYFNPRPPWGGRLIFGLKKLLLQNFNPRPPWGGRL